MIDPSNMEDDPVLEALPKHGCIPYNVSDSAQFMPHLIDVAALPARQQEGLGELLWRETSGERPPVVCAWLASTLHIEALARHIKRFLVGPGSHGGLTVWRYHDPRVFSLAKLVLTSVQMNALIGPVIDWRLPWCGLWWSVPGTGKEAPPLEGIEPAWPDPAQWASLAHSDTISSVMAQLQRKRPALDAADHLRDQQQILAALLDAQRRLHLSHPYDLADYALHRVLYGIAFQHHPKLAIAWAALEQGELYWPAILDMLSARDKQVMEHRQENASLNPEANNVPSAVSQKAMQLLRP